MSVNAKCENVYTNKNSFKTHEDDTVSQHVARTTFFWKVIWSSCVYMIPSLLEHVLSSGSLTITGVLKKLLYNTTKFAPHIFRKVWGRFTNGSLKSILTLPINSLVDHG